MSGGREKVYIETTVVSYLTAPPSRDVVVAGRQEVTREHWPRLPELFDRYISALVVQEASKGDSDAATKRLKALERLPVLAVDETSEKLAAALVREGPMPEECPEDALHIALATTNGMDYLLTWNFSHINNAQMKHGIAKVVEEYGYECPVICTLDELIGDE